MSSSMRVCACAATVVPYAAARICMRLSLVLFKHPTHCSQRASRSARKKSRTIVNTHPQRSRRRMHCWCLPLQTRFGVKRSDDAGNAAVKKRKTLRSPSAMISNVRPCRPMSGACAATGCRLSHTNSPSQSAPAQLRVYVVFFSPLSCQCRLRSAQPSADVLHPGHNITERWNGHLGRPSTPPPLAPAPQSLPLGRHSFGLQSN